MDEVNKLDENTYECLLAEMKMLGKTIQPKLVLEVQVGDVVKFNVSSMSLVSNDKFIEKKSKDTVFVSSGVTLLQKEEDGETVM